VRIATRFNVLLFGNRRRDLRDSSRIRWCGLFTQIRKRSPTERARCGS
jgi:hypothetical protein